MTHPLAGAHPLRAGPPGAPDVLLEGLTPEQTQAVSHGLGPLLVVAGPGAGKTKTLTHRVARLLATGLAEPWEILAVTFSVRAAGELRLRLADLLGEHRARGVTAATFHSVCARLLREHATVFGRTDAYTVYDQADVRKVIEWLLSDAQRGRIQLALADCGQPASAEVLEEISLAKNRLLSPDSYEHTARHPAARLIAAVWRETDVELRRSNAWDFDDLLVYAVRLLAEHPHRLAFYRQRWRWLLVDEFQDTNEAQGVLVALLAGAGGNVTCVADDDQLIYSWRGAAPRNVLAFGERFPGHAQIVLGRNFRCRAEILDAAVACVAHNEQRTAKALIAMRGPGGRAQVLAFGSDRHEAQWVAGQIADRLAAGVLPTEVLVLARAGYASQPVQAALAQAGIPHRVLGSLGLYERSEVRDALAYLALLANPADAQAFRRAIQSPRRGVGVTTANRVVALARAEH
ncbi:MAG: ATP-dependent helicase, partial [Solirubrobacteraceae bacterium]